MFLIASYVPAFAPVNKYFPPSQWFVSLPVPKIILTSRIHLSITIWEIFTVFVPIYEVLRLQVLSKKAAHSNAKFDTPLSPSQTPYSTEWINMSSPTLTPKSHPVESIHEYMGDRLYTMDALDHVLRENPDPLQEFSALSDFSGENIAFLTRTAAWKASFPHAIADADQLFDVYNQALWIYTAFISPRDAEFPLNISSHDLRPLQAIFEKPARILCGEGSVNPATPFEPSNSGSTSDDSELLPQDINIKARYTGEIPAGFDAAVFDHVEEHIRYLVLTNTWPKFVDAMRRRSSESGRSATGSHLTDRSGMTVRSWLSSKTEKLKAML